MIMRLYRQRRRAIFVFVATTFMMLVVNRLNPENDLNFLSLIVGAALTGFVTAAIVSIIICFVLPMFRYLVETIAIMIVISAALRAVLPDGETLDALLSYVPFICVMLFLVVLSSPVLDRFYKQKQSTSRQTVLISAGRERVFQGLYPSLQHASDYFYRNTVFTPYGNASEQLLAIYPDRSGQLYQASILTLTSTDGKTYGEYDFAPLVANAATGGLSGTFKFWIEHNDLHEYRVTIEETRYDIPLRRLIFWYFEDEFADRVDCMKAEIEGQPNHSFFAMSMPPRSQTTG
ncbi:hypothetical protein [Pseudaestuariivita rosea]|uniref:hypothetical protein n=1 Tax=Pseudaestuariivita rosea TaxID=2763263 RepID=UPI001ABB15F1|nr:hypothetical protein [Pseudaestuariivita rosea]